MHTTLDTERYAAAVYDVPAQAAWRVRVGGSYLLAVRGISPDLGTIELLEAYAVMTQEQPWLGDVRLVVAGRSWEAAREYVADFRARAVELGVAPVLVPDVSDRDLPTLVAAASGFVHLPASSDCCADALRALAAGVPVVARDVPGVRAVLADAVAYGDTVLSIADALVDVLTDPPEPAAGAALASGRTAAATSEDGVVEQEPDRRDGGEE